jgi:chromosome partitioning protein
LVVPTGVGIRLIPAHYDLTKVDALFGNNRAISGHLRRGLAQHLGRLGRPILIDCSPSLGVLTLNAILAARRVLVPVAADWMSLRAVERFNAALSVLGPRLPAGFQRRVVVTRFDPRRRLSHEIHARLREMFGADLCAQRIGECVALAESPARGQDIFRYAPHSQAARDYAGLHEELCATGFFAAELVAKAA